MTAAFSGNTELVFSYDPLGQIKTQWDCPPSGIARGSCYVISALYDALGNTTSLTYPDGRTVTTAYNSAGRFLRTDLASFNGPVNFNYYTVPQNTSPASWGYWPSGAMNRGTFGNGVVETDGYNNRLQLNSIADVKGSSTIFSKTFNYVDGSGHNNGDILGIADTQNAAKDQSFSYDSLNRILTGSQADNAFSLTYSYDPWGNMHEFGTSNFTQPFDNLNRIQQPPLCAPLAMFCYDAAGNLLMDNHGYSFAYDAEERIKTVAGNGSGAYTYNPLGNRVRKDVGSVSTEYFFFGPGVIAELNPATSAWTDYIFGYGKRLAKDTSTNGSGAQYYQDDQLGSARIMTDSAGTVISNCTFNPFGEQVSCSPDNPSNHYRFTGKERDSESGLDDFGARYFSSSMGHWMTPDWSARPTTVPYAEFGDPQSLNLYLYVRNDPISRADADGHISDQCGGKTDCTYTVKFTPPDENGNRALTISVHTLDMHTNNDGTVTGTSVTKTSTTTFDSKGNVTGGTVKTETTKVKLDSTSGDGTKTMVATSPTKVQNVSLNAEKAFVSLVKTVGHEAANDLTVGWTPGYKQVFLDHFVADLNEHKEEATWRIVDAVGCAEGGFSCAAAVTHTVIDTVKAFKNPNQ